MKKDDILLKEHNRETVKNIVGLFEAHNRVAVEQATATGKSYVIAGAIKECGFKKVLFLTSSAYIFKEFKNNFTVLDNYVDVLDYMTYSKTLYIDADGLKDTTYDLIVLDEYHRLGSENWGRAVSTLLTKCSNAKVLGTTATPVRYLDGCRNMTTELFDDVVASKITLVDAIDLNILVKPKYVVGFYDISDDVSKIVEKYNTHKKYKGDLVDEVKYVTSNFNNLCGVNVVLKKNIVDERKFIVFCANATHLREMLNIVPKWFEDAFGVDVNTYTMYTGNTKSNVAQFESFKVSDKNSFQLLFVVSMLNEGVHIDTDGLIMLRHTKSPILYYQQLGRGLVTDSVKPPIIFDFVKNSSCLLSLTYNPIKKSEDTGATLKLNEKTIVDYSSSTLFDVVDESINVISMLKELENKLDNWGLMYRQLEEYKAVNGHCDVTAEEDTLLFEWCGLQRKVRAKGGLSEDKYLKLVSLGLILTKSDRRWMDNYKKLLAYYSVHKHSNVPRSYEDKELAEWIKTQRTYKDTMDSKRLELLKAVDFVFDLAMLQNDNLWSDMYVVLLEYKATFGDVNVSSRYEDTKLANWVSSQRKAYKKGTLSPLREQKLRSVGFKLPIVTLK